MASCAQGAMSRFYTEPGSSPHTFDSNSETYEFVYETLQKHARIVGGNAIRGTRSAAKERTREGAYSVGGLIVVQPSPAFLDLWLPRILGATEASDVFALSETLPSFGVLMDKVTQTFQYTDGMVSKALFSGQAGPAEGGPDIITLALQLVFFTRTLGTSVPNVSLSTASNNSIYVHSDAVFTFGGAAREVKDWSVMVDNHVKQRFTNSLSATKSCPASRTVAVSARLPYDTDTDDLLDQATAGASGTIALTNAAQTGLTTTFNFAALQVPSEDPIVRGKTEIDLFLNMIARKSGSTAELSVTNDSTV